MPNCKSPIFFISFMTYPILVFFSLVIGHVDNLKINHISRRSIIEKIPPLTVGSICAGPLLSSTLKPLDALAYDNIGNDDLWYRLDGIISSSSSSSSSFPSTSTTSLPPALPQPKFTLTQPDLYYPDFLTGVWDVTSRTRGIEAPCGVPLFGGER